jgi:succinate-semialdehyde dehydrogenase/glutarate-semialdehyde dehydrogenase
VGIARAIDFRFPKDRVTAAGAGRDHTQPQSSGIRMSAHIKPVDGASFAYPELTLFIDGEWLGREGRKTQAVVNPATEEVLGQLPHATPADLDRALAAAQRSWGEWRALLPVQRAKILRKAADLMRARGEEIARTATLEMGKTLTETRIELQASAEVFDWYADEGRRAYGRVLPQRLAGQRMTIVKEPVGPVAAFAPWNFPLGNPARKIGAALAAGCTCILKPAEEAAGAALAVARALHDAGVPKGVLAIVFGVPHEISTHLLASPIIRKVSFTGSIPVGKQLTKLAADGMKRTTMELGGHAPVLVFDDIDVEKVLDACVAAKYRNAGQVCVSPTRFYVHESIYAKFAAGFAARAKALPVGDGMDEANRMGPLAHARRLPAVQGIIDEALTHGAKLLAGGKRIARKGFFFEPTVLADVPNSARIMNDEPFGPIAILNPFRDFDAVMAEANRLPFGLAAFGFTNNAQRVNLLGERLEAGMIGINSFQISVPEAPFGGVKESGHGSEEGIEGLDACLVTKFISQS